MGVGDTFALYLYSSDDGGNYVVKLSATIAAQGGFGSPVGLEGNKAWPYGSKNMRKVYGKSTDGSRTHLPCATSSNGFFVSGGTFTTKAGAFTVQGRIGEKREERDIGG